MALEFSPALITPALARITRLPTNALPNILAANIPNSTGRNPSFSSFASFLLVLVTLILQVI